MDYAYFNGKIAEKNTIGLPFDDIGALRNYGMNEVLRTYNHKPFLFDLHMDRLFRSAKILNINIQYSRDSIYDAMCELIRLNIGNDQEGSIKLVLTGGVSTDALAFNPDTPSLYMLVSPFKALPEDVYTQGVKVVTMEHQRIMPEIKSLNYILAILGQKDKNEKGALEIVYHKDGLMLEAATSNLFIVKNGTIITPEKRVLWGITRHSTLYISRQKYPVEERDVSVSEMLEADEFFLVATNKDIVPIIQIDDHQVGTGDTKGQIGPITKDLMTLYKKYVKENTEI